MRSGLITQKVGMTRLFADGKHVPVTVLKVEDLQVVATRTAEKDGYTAVQLGYGKARVKNVILRKQRWSRRKNWPSFGSPKPI